MAASRVQTRLPIVVNWGEPSLAITQLNGRTIYYPNGMELEVHLPGTEIVLLEKIRVVNSKAEHRFLGRNVSGSGDWRQSRSSAFHDCLQKLGVAMGGRGQIFGPSHPSIQDGVKLRFVREKIAPVLKRVTWGDDNPIVTDEPTQEYPYGGWGLLAFHTIPNRDQLREMMAEDCLEDDDDELFENYEAEEDYFVQEAASLDFPKEVEEDDLENGSWLASKKYAVKRPLRVDDDELTLYPSSDEEEEEVEEEEAQFLPAEQNMFKRQRIEDGEHSSRCGKRSRADPFSSTSVFEG